MREPLVESQMKEFCALQQRINTIYDQHARKHDCTYTNGLILSLIAREPRCTQKRIHEITLLPKQTINNVITALYRQGLVELMELPEDRRSKEIHLTSKGERDAGPYVSSVEDAEYAAMAELDPKQRRALLDAMKAYCLTFAEAMGVRID